MQAVGSRPVFVADTVLIFEEAEAVAQTGARMFLSPNCDPAVIRATKGKGLLSRPYVLTPANCSSVLACGLEIFPASVLGTSGVAALGAMEPAG